MSVDDQLAERFVCSKCENRGAEASRFAATGTGISRLFNRQYRHFIVVSCSNCGYTEMYNPNILEGRDRLHDILDALFGA